MGRWVQVCKRRQREREGGGQRGYKEAETA